MQIILTYQVQFDAHFNESTSGTFCKLKLIILYILKEMSISRDTDGCSNCGMSQKEI